MSGKRDAELSAPTVSVPYAGQQSSPVTTPPTDSHAKLGSTYPHPPTRSRYLEKLAPDFKLGLPE